MRVVLTWKIFKLLDIKDEVELSVIIIAYYSCFVFWFGSNEDFVMIIDSGVCFNTEMSYLELGFTLQSLEDRIDANMAKSYGGLFSLDVTYYEFIKRNYLMLLIKWT